MRGEAGAASANATLATALSVQLRLFAPFLPFVTEEVWSWWQEGSVHRAPWPTADELAAGAGGDPAAADSVGWPLSELRKAKSERKVSMRTELASAAVSGPGSGRGRRRGRRPARRRHGSLSDLALTRRRLELALDGADLGDRLGRSSGGTRRLGASSRAARAWARLRFSRGTRVGLTCSRTTSPVMTTRATSWRPGTSYIT